MNDERYEADDERYDRINRELTAGALAAAGPRPVPWDGAVRDVIPTLKGHLTLAVYEGDVERDEDGNILNPLVEVIERDNLVLTTGKNLYLDRLFALGTPPAALTHMGVGATAAAAAVGDTQLGSTPTLKAFDALPTRSGLAVTAITTFLTSEANISWNEIGLFNGSVNGTSIMFNRIAPIGPFAKTSAVSIVATIVVTAT